LPVRGDQVSDDSRSPVGRLLSLPKLPPAYGFGRGNIRGLCGTSGVVHGRNAQGVRILASGVEKLLRAMRVTDQLSRGAVSGRSSFLCGGDGSPRTVCAPGACASWRAYPLVRNEGQSGALRAHGEGLISPPCSRL